MDWLKSSQSQSFFMEQSFRLLPLMQQERNKNATKDLSPLHCLGYGNAAP
ncbi:hypothetical protein [Herbaspirillum sp. CF444]|nr:hypothetical protein [Herbaspirillum sp. CF444]